MCNFWNKHSCVCFSEQRSRQSGSPAAACSWSLAPWDGRHQGEDAPPEGHRLLPSRWICLEAKPGPLGSAWRDLGNAGVPGEEVNIERPPEAFSRWNGSWSPSAGQLAIGLSAGMEEGRGKASLVGELHVEGPREGQRPARELSR